jgi:DNA-binding IclR family transcriptional regulator
MASPRPISTPLTQGIAVVRLLLLKGYALGVTQIADEIGMPKSSLHRLLKTLCQIGFVQQNEKNFRYGVSAEIFDFLHEGAALFGRNLKLDEPMRAAATALQASVYLDMLGGRNAYVVCAAGDEGNTLRLGRKSPAYASSAGKILVAQLAEDTWSRYAPLPGEKPATTHTSTDPERFYARLREARERGFAWSHREISPDHVSVAAIVQEPLVHPPRLAVAIVLRHEAYCLRDQAELEAAVLKLADKLTRVIALKR